MSDELDQAALLEALRAQTVEAFGEDSLEQPTASLPPELPPAPPRAPERFSSHLCFLGGLGGLVSALLAGAFVPTAGLRGELFARVVRDLPLPAPMLLLIGGVLVGFGTRMAGGCTSGHGLCGVSRFQPGSLVATASFFGAGIATSLLLEAWL